MWTRMTSLGQIYRDETRFDWGIFAANAACVLLVLAASVHARSAISVPHATLEIASSEY